MVVKVTGAAGWVFPPELGGKEPLYPKGMGLGKEQAARSLSLLWEGIWGLPYGFPSACVPVCQLPACPGHLGTWSFWDRAAKASTSVWHRMEKDGGTAGSPILPYSPGDFFGHGLAVLKPPQGREISSELS